MAQLIKASHRSISVFNFVRLSARTFATPATSEPPKSSDQDRVLSNKTHRVDDFEKKLLVWAGKYKTKEEVPSYVEPGAVDKARNRFRIRVANIMMVLTFIGCIFMVMSGKKAQEGGESVTKMNQDWHKEYQQKAIAEANAAKAK